MSGHIAVRRNPAVEQTVLDALCAAADAGQVCPTNLALEILIGVSSGSVVPKIVAKLEQNGLIAVQRYQRFRRVQIRQSGNWTAISASQRGFTPHVPRGVRRQGPEHEA
jgi:hypothetical protein